MRKKKKNKKKNKKISLLSSAEFAQRVVKVKAIAMTKTGLERNTNKIATIKVDKWLTAPSHSFLDLPWDFFFSLFVLRIQLTRKD